MIAVLPSRSFVISTSLLRGRRSLRDKTPALTETHRSSDEEARTAECRERLRGADDKSERGPAAVHHRGGRHFEVLDERVSDGRVQIYARDGCTHVPHPGVALPASDRKREMTHAQLRVATALAVPARAAPVLDEEQPQVLGCSGEHGRVLRIKRPQQGVIGDTG